MEPIALLFVLFGLPGAIWPYRTARFEEQLDAIGSKRRWSEIEPADWKVMLTRYVGIVMVGAGILWFLSG